MVDSNDWHHSATVFLSYRRVDADEVKALQSELHAIGVHAWRDVTHLDVGRTTRGELARVINEECDAFLLYVTPDCLTSTFIWEEEVPAAFERCQRDSNFGIIPVLRGVSFAQLRQCCAGYSVPDLAEFNGIQLDFSDKATLHANLRTIAQRVLQATLRQHLPRVPALSRIYQPSLCLHVSSYTSLIDHLDLDLNWAEFFTATDDGRGICWPGRDEWQGRLLPALYSVQSVLSALPHSRILHIDIHAPLPVGFALGFVFPLSARFTLILENGYRTWHSRVSDASSAGNLAEEPLHINTVDLHSGEANSAVIALSISRDVTAAVTAQLPALGIEARYHVQMDIKGGPASDAVRDEVHAVAIARQFAREVRNLYDRKQVTHLHLFFAAPVELAVLLGYHLNATGTVSVYQYVASESRYIPGCELVP